MVAMSIALIIVGPPPISLLRASPPSVCSVGSPSAKRRRARSRACGGSPRGSSTGARQGWRAGGRRSLSRRRAQCFGGALRAYPWAPPSVVRRLAVVAVVRPAIAVFFTPPDRPSANLARPPIDAGEAADAERLGV